MPSFRAAGGTSLGGDILRPFRTSFSRSAYITDVIFFILCPIPTVATSALFNILRLSRVTVGGGGPALRPGADVESPAGDQCGVSFREHQLCVLLVPYAGCPSGGRCRVSFRVPQHGLRPGADVIDLHEIHLARQSSLQVPVGHIPVPGGIKLCSPGTFLVANYLIINNGSCQVNFTKPKRATIRYTNSQ